MIDYKGQLPIPQQWFRKHDFGSGNYETLSFLYVPERFFDGTLKPRILECTMFGTLVPQEKFSAPDVETGRAFLDGRFASRFAGHQCNEDCTGWSKLTEKDTPSDEEPISQTIQ